MKNSVSIFKRGLAVFAAASAVAGAAALGVFLPRRAHADTVAPEAGDIGVNVLRSSADGALDILPASVMYGVASDISVPRPEHGDTVVYKFTAGESDICEFAVVFEDSNIAYYEVKQSGGKPVADTDKPITDDAEGGHFRAVVEGLDAGVYGIAAYVPQFDAAASDTHTHWWTPDAAADDADTVYGELNAEYILEILPYNIEKNPSGAFAWQFADGDDPSVVFDGTVDNIPELSVTFGGVDLEYDVDYVAYGSTANVGDADLIISGRGNYGGELVVPGAYSVTIAQNDWAVGGAPAAIPWNYGAFIDGVNGFVATPMFLDEGMSVIYYITYDDGASEIVEGLSDFTVTDGHVGDDIAKALNGLDAGTYYLTARVEDTVNYTAVEPYTVRFDVLVADNAWNVTPYIMQWNYGGYDKTLNVIEAKARYSDEKNPVRFTVSTDAEGKNAIKGLDGFVAPDGIVPDEVAEVLADLDAGLYYLTSAVRGTQNYGALAPAAMKFRISKAENYWDVAPNITPWIVGEYDAQVNKLTAVPHFGTARVIVRNTSAENNIVYDPMNGDGTAVLGDLPAGAYILTVIVDGTDNYSVLDHSSVFRVAVPETELIKRGLPWWGTLIIAIGALGIAAGIIVILHMRGVFKVTSAKALDDYKLEQTQRVVAAAVYASKLDAERKAEAEARERELEAQRANEQATAVEAEEVADAAAALDSAPTDAGAVAGEIAQGDAETAQTSAESDGEPAPEPKKNAAKKSAATGKSKSTSARSTKKQDGAPADTVVEKPSDDAATDDKPSAVAKKPAAKKKPSPKKM